MPNGHVWHSIDANRMWHTTEWCQNRGRCRNPELNLSCRGIVCNSLIKQTLTRICKVIFSHFCNFLAIANYQALGLTHSHLWKALKELTSSTNLSPKQCPFTIRTKPLMYNWGVMHQSHHVGFQHIFCHVICPVYPAHILVKHFPDDVSHWGDTSEISQSGIYVIACFIAMNGSG